MAPRIRLDVMRSFWTWRRGGALEQIGQPFPRRCAIPRLRLMHATDDDQDAVVGYALAGQDDETIDDVPREIDGVQVETQLDDRRLAIEMTAGRPHRVDETLLNVPVIN